MQCPRLFGVSVSGVAAVALVWVLITTAAASAGLAPAHGALVSFAVAEERSHVVTASAYNSTPEQTDDTPNEGAWGDEITPGMKVIAVSPDLIAAGLDRGTKLRVEGLSGTWTVLDRTAARHRNRIDIYMGTDVDAAREWGIRKVTIRLADTAETLDGSGDDRQGGAGRP